MLVGNAIPFGRIVLAGCGNWLIIGATWERKCVRRSDIGPRCGVKRKELAGGRAVRSGFGPTRYLGPPRWFGALRWTSRIALPLGSFRGGYHGEFRGNPPGARQRGAVQQKMREQALRGFADGSLQVGTSGDCRPDPDGTTLSLPDSFGVPERIAATAGRYSVSPAYSGRAG